MATQSSDKEAFWRQQVNEGEETTTTQSFMENALSIGYYMGLVVICAIIYIVISSESFGDISAALGDLAGAAASIAKMFGDHPWLIIFLALASPLIAVISGVGKYLSQSLRIRVGKIRGGFYSSKAALVVAKIQSKRVIRSQLSNPEEIKLFDDLEKRLDPSDKSLNQDEALKTMRTESPEVDASSQKYKQFQAFSKAEMKNIEKWGTSYFNKSHNDFSKVNWEGDLARTNFDMFQGQADHTISEMLTNPDFVMGKNDIYALQVGGLLHTTAEEFQKTEGKTKILWDPEATSKYRAGQTFVNSYTKIIATMYALDIDVDELALMSSLRKVAGKGSNIESLSNACRELEGRLNEFVGVNDTLPPKDLVKKMSVDQNLKFKPKITKRGFLDPPANFRTVSTGAQIRKIKFKFKF